MPTPSLEVPKPHFKKCEAGISESAGSAPLEVQEWHPSYKEKRNTEQSHTEISLSVCGGAGLGDAEREKSYHAAVRSMSEQEQLAQILENCELWIFDPDTAKVFANAIERLFYSDSFRIGKAVLPQANVRSRLWDLDGIVLQTVQSKLSANQRDVKNSTAYTMAVIFNTICETHSDILVDPYLNSLNSSPVPPAGK